MPATSVNVTLPQNSTQVPDNNSGAQIIRRAYGHETCILTINGLSDTALKLRTNDPISVRCVPPAGGATTFVGYIYFVRPYQDNVPNNRTTEVIALGPTMVMKQAHQTVWTNVTVSDIARQLCLRYSLTADVDDNLSPVLDMVAQRGNESDWSFLCRISKKYGALVYPNNTTVTVRSRDSRLSVRQMLAPSFIHQTNLTGQPSVIRSFSGVIGDATPTPDGLMRARQVINGIINNKYFSAINDGTATDATRPINNPGIYTRYIDDVAFNSADKAYALLDSQVAMAAPTYKSTASLAGNSSVSAGTSVYLGGLEAEYDGYWDVTSVTHFFDDSFDYVMDVELETSSLGYITPIQPAQILQTPILPATSSLLAVPPGPAQTGPKMRWRGSVAVAAPTTRINTNTQPRVHI
jgi:hypothetical protein